MASTEALISEDGVSRGNMQSLEQGVKKQKQTNKQQKKKLSRGVTKAWQQPCRKWLWVMAINLRRKKRKKEIRILGLHREGISLCWMSQKDQT